MSEETEPREIGHCLGQQINVLGDNLFILGGEPSEVPAGWARLAARPSLTGSTKRAALTIDAGYGLAGRPEGGAPVAMITSTLSWTSSAANPAWRSVLSFRPAVLDAEVLPLDPPQVAQALPKRVEGRGLEVRVSVAEEAEARQSLLRRCASMASGAARFKMSVTMHRRVLHHMVVSSHQPHADFLLSMEAEQRLKRTFPGYMLVEGKCSSQTSLQAVETEIFS